MRNLKRSDTNELTKQRLTNLEKKNYGYQGGRMVERASQGVWDGHGQAAILKMDKKHRPTVQAQGTLLSVMWQLGWEGSLEESGYMYVCLSPFTVHLKLSHC